MSDKQLREIEEKIKLETSPRPWPFQTLEEIKALDLPPRKPIIGPFNSASVFVVGAERGTGKTMWMTEIANGVASGNGFCDWRCEQPGPVAFVQLDMPVQAVQNRAKQCVWDTNFHYVTRWHFKNAEMPCPDLGNAEHHEGIIAALSGYRMAIFDTRRAAQPPGEGAAANMWHPSYWLQSQPVRHALADAGVCVVFLDHLNSAGAIKDTKSIEDDVDSIITLKDSDKGEFNLCFHVELSKDRDHTGSNCFFQFDGKKWQQFTDSSLKEKVWAHRQNNTVADTAERFGISERTVKNYVREINGLKREEGQKWR